MWVTGKKWCDYFACKLDHDDPENDTCPEMLMWRIHYSEDYVEKWMKPRLFYFSQCLMLKTPPDLSLYDEKPPQIDTEDLLSFPENMDFSD